MKKLLLSLFLLLALYAPAQATDVTISAVTIDGFSPSNIGTDRLIAVSVAGGSPIVTSAGLFPSAIVGLSGFTVRIDGTQYTVASVASTSSLTLTVNYSGTPGAQTMTLFRYVEMRVYADKAFQPLGSSQIVQPGAVGSGAFFRRFAASVVNNGSTNQLFIPQIVLPATTDALITNTARYSFPFFTPGGAQINFFLCPSSLAQLRLPPATPTTWTAICSFNSASAIIPPNREAYSKGEIDARLPSCTLNNGVFYSASGSILSCLTLGSGLTVVGSTLEASAGGSGYNRIQEEGANLAQRAILNFIGTSFTAVDNAGLTRTDVSADPDLNALASIIGTGFTARTAADTWLLRTHTGTANEITVTNGNGVSGNPTYSLPAALTFTGKTVTGGTFATPTITTPTITGGTHTAITGLGIRSTGSGAFDLTFANAENLAAGRTLTFALNDVSRVLNLGGNLTTGGLFSTTGTFSTGGNFSTGAAFTTTPANALTLTTTGATNVTLPTTGTLATLAGSEAFTNKTLTSPRIGTSILDTNGNELINLTATASAVNEITYANAATGGSPTVSASGGDSNIDITLTPKGTGKVGIGTPGASPVAGIVGGPNASGTNTAGVALNLAGGSGTGNAEPGQVSVRYPLKVGSGTTVQSLSTDRFPVVACLFTNTANATAIANTTTETSLFAGITASAGSTRVLEAGVTAAGTLYRVTLKGLLGTTGTPTGRVQAKLNSTTVSDTGAVNMPTNSGGNFQYEFTIRVATVGATGAVLGTGLFNGSPGGVAPTPTIVFSNGSATIDFTMPQTIDVTFIWGTASASNSMILTSAIIERLR